jgi:hypothetical protein
MKLQTPLFAVVLILLSSTFLWGQQIKTSEYKVYRDPSLPFSLFYPNDWKQVEPSYAQTRFKAVSSLGRGLSDFSINTNYIKELEKLTPEAYVKFIEANPEVLTKIATTAIPNAKIISKGKTYISNREAYFARYEGTYKNLDNEYFLMFYQIFVLFEGNLYTLTFRSPKENFEDELPTFKFIASSMVLRPTKFLDDVKPKKAPIRKRND